jgi:hypothetical protein
MAFILAAQGVGFELPGFRSKKIGGWNSHRLRSRRILLSLTIDKSNLPCRFPVTSCAPAHC